MNWKDIKNIIKEELKEAEVTAGNTKFTLRMGVNRNKTKLGIKIQFEPKGDPLSPDINDKLEVVLQEKLNELRTSFNQCYKNFRKCIYSKFQVRL